MPDIRNTRADEGTRLLMDVADQLHRSSIQKRQLELEETLQKAKLAQLKDDNSVANLQATANMLNALQQSGAITQVDTEELTKRIPLIKEFTPYTKEQRKADAQIAVEEKKGDIRENVARVKGALDINKIQVKAEKDLSREQYKQQEIGTRQKQALAIDSAKFGVTPADVAKGLEAVQEANPLLADKIRTGQTAIVIPGKKIAVGDLSLAELGKKTITTDDIIDVLGSDTITPRISTGLERLNLLLTEAKTSQEKAQTIKQFLEVFPNLAPLFEEK